jgi:UDP-GlcNAc3NAcA epimerase
MRVVTVVGARPQFIKAAVVSRAFRDSTVVEEILLHTGQHYDRQMSKVFFEELEIPKPAYDLGIGSGPHGQQTGAMLAGIETVLSERRPDAVLVYGDTNSTLAGALAAVKMHIPVLHVEAGLRSFNRNMPEEINRVVSDQVSDVLFAPTEAALRNLDDEGIPSERIHKVGDVMYDAALYYASRAELRSTVLFELNIPSKTYALATVHRAENTDDANRLRVICGTLARVAEQMPVIFPVHPRTRKILSQSSLSASLGGVQVTESVGYLDMLMLEKNARIIMTDSGGVQKEAFFYQVPCVTFRGETEWLELVELGWNRLAPPVSSKSQLRQIAAALEGAPGNGHRPYGNGDAARRIARLTEALLSKRPRASRRSRTADFAAHRLLVTRST